MDVNYNFCDCQFISKGCVNFDCSYIPIAGGQAGSTCEGTYNDYAHEAFNSLGDPPTLTPTQTPSTSNPTMRPTLIPTPQPTTPSSMGQGPWQYCNTTYCECSGFDFSLYTGTIVCTSGEDFCDPLTRVCTSSITQEYTIEAGSIEGYYTCANLSYPIEQSVCYRDPGYGTTCSISVDGTTCSSCFYDRDNSSCLSFDCANVGGNEGSSCDEEQTFATDAMAAFAYAGTPIEDQTWYFLCQQTYYNLFAGYCDCSRFDTLTATGDIDCFVPNYCWDGEEGSFCGQITNTYAVDRFGSYEQNLCYYIGNIETCYQISNQLDSQATQVCTVNGIECESCNTLECYSFDCSNTELGTFGSGVLNASEGYCSEYALIHPAFGFEAETLAPTIMTDIPTDVPSAVSPDQSSLQPSPAPGDVPSPPSSASTFGTKVTGLAVISSGITLSFLAFG